MILLEKKELYSSGPPEHVHTEEFEDTKWIIRNCISKKNRQHSGQKKKYKITNNHL